MILSLIRSALIIIAIYIYVSILAWEDWGYGLESLYPFSAINASLIPLLSQQHMEPREAVRGDLWSMNANIGGGANHLEQFLRITSRFPSVVTDLSLTISTAFSLANLDSFMFL